MAWFMSRPIAKLKSNFHVSPKGFIMKVIAIILAGAMIILVLYYLTAPPYPSEVTPLSFIGNGIRWTQNFDINYSSSQYVRMYIGDGTHVANFTIQYRGSGNSSPYFANISNPHSMGALSLSLSITDANDNGRLDRGDSLSITMAAGQSFLNDTTYEVSVDYAGPILDFNYLYYFAFHNGVFYTWNDHTHHFVY